MDITVYKYGTLNTIRAVIAPDADSEQSITLMAEDQLTINFTITAPIFFQVGDFCFWYGKLYQINALPKRTLNANRSISYVLVMESEMYDLGKVEFLFLDENDVFTDAVFPFRGTAQDYGDLLIYNLNRVYPIAGWQLGSVVVTDFVSQDFTGVNCLAALKTIASIFQTEYLVEGKVINIFQRQTSSGLLLQYGEDKPLLSIEEDNQTNANIITRLYAYGSTKNITSSYRNASTRLRLGAINYIEKNVILYRIWEACVIFDGSTSDVKTNSPLPEIFPHRTGIITAVDPNTVTNFFLNFYDTAINFNVNTQAITGITAQVVFNSGLLAGYTFDINSFDNTTKKFVINQNTSQPSLIVPTAALAPAVGDEYVIINITMPQAYIDQAEADLKAAAQEYLDENCIPPIAYVINCNPIYFKKNNIQFVLGQSVTIESDILILNRSIRITSYKRNLRDPYAFSVGLSDTVKPNSIIVKLINGL